MESAVALAKHIASKPGLRYDGLFFFPGHLKSAADPNAHEATMKQISTFLRQTIDAIAAREACSRRHVHMTISLAFLAPSLVKAAVEARLPLGIGVARLFDAPVAWSHQHRMLGLAQ